MTLFRDLVGVCLGLAVLLATDVLRTVQAGETRPSLTFEAHVRPILKAHCFPCHGEEPKLKGKLDVRLVRLLKRGGDSGEAITPGNHAESLLWERLDADEMPPGEKKLSHEQKQVIADWIDQGARTARDEPATLDAVPIFTEEERNFWSFRPIKDQAVPPVPQDSPARNEIDAFLLKRLQAEGLGFAPEAERASLIRRASFDLLGLPPTPEEVAEFVQDARPDAYERLIDRLLASPHYGERWARHWMDVAGYADSDGYSPRDDVRPYAYKYRDYLIRSINADRPWDVLIREQLAGDETLTPPYKDLGPEEADRLIATGFLRSAPDGTADPESDPPVARNDVLAETVKIVSTAFLGLTVGCAQCHDHRYDPISQEDYYRFRALFEPALDPANWRVPSGRLISLWGEAERTRASEIDAKVKAIEAERSRAVDELVAKVLEAELAQVPEALRPRLREARDVPAGKRSSEQNQLIRDYPRVVVSPGNVSLYDGKAHGEIMTAFGKKIAEAKVGRPPEDFVQALTETPGHAPVTRLFDRGDVTQPRQAVEPGELEVLAGATGSPEIPVDDPEVPTTGRRLAYARHLTSGRHPLVPRVLVNRVWMHHFGKGIVASPGDFGALGEKPSHPELLDWLADRFVKGGWTLKPIHRLVMTSAAYRQSSRRDPSAEEVDPDNRLLARASVRRLEAEPLRDAVLFASGRLNTAMFGPPVPVSPDESGQVIVGIDNRDSAGRPTARRGSLGDQEFRRSVYIQVRRTLPLALLESFDAPATSPNCERRDVSTVAPQSLLMMNNDFLISESEAFAARVEKEAGDDPSAQVKRAWRLALGIEPTPAQVESATRFLASQRDDLAGSAALKDAGEAERLALSSFCQALLSSNAFLYVD